MRPRNYQDFRLALGSFYNGKTLQLRGEIHDGKTENKSTI